MKKLSLLILILLALIIVPSVGAQDGTDTEETVDPIAVQRVNAAMAHLSSYLELDGTISISAIDADSEDIPYVTYTWVPVTYTSSAMGCTVAGVEYDYREVPAFRVRITVYGYTTYDYRVSYDGRAVLLCFYNGPSDTSIGLDLSTSNSLGTAYDRSATNYGGLVGATARIDQAMRHVSDYLNFYNTITWDRVQNNDPYIAPTFYQWLPIYYNYTGSGCPIVLEGYDAAATYGYEIVLTVNDRDYTYYANQDGTLLILCINGRASTSSVIPE